MNLDNLTKLAKLHYIFDSARTRAALIGNIYVSEAALTKRSL